MKKIFFSIAFLPLFLSSVTAFGQDRNNSISAYADVNFESSFDPRTNDLMSRVHEVFYGLQYRYYLPSDFYLQGNAGYSQLKNTAVEIGAAHHLRLVRGLPLSFTVGAGIGVVFLDNDSYVNKRVGMFIPQGGFDFRPPALPLNIFAAYRPKFDLDGFDVMGTATVQFGVGFRF